MMLRVSKASTVLFLLASGAWAQDRQAEYFPPVNEIFTESAAAEFAMPVSLQETASTLAAATTNAPGSCLAPEECVGDPCDGETCLSVTGGCDSVHCDDDGWLSGLFDDTPLLACLKNQEVGCWSYSIGGALRYRYLDESNRLRPPLTGRQSDYQQWRFTPYLEVKRGDAFTGYVQGIDAPTFGNELPEVAIDQNRFDLLQYYGDFKVTGGKTESMRFRAGRQLLQYGSQHLVSPLAWANTFRNFEGYKLYYTSPNWDIDGFAVRPVNGASGHFDRQYSFDTPDQSRWFSGVYSTWKKAPKGTLDLYWLWLNEDEDRADRIDGNRHTFGARYAGKHPVKDECGDLWITHTWDWEGAFQVGEDVVGAGPAQDVQAGFFSATNGLTFEQMPWTPTLSGIFFWGSGDDDPNDGDLHTVSTLFPLGHAYWGMIDNFSGQNLFDYCMQATVKPTKKLTLLSAIHWFQKAQAEDAIWNVAGAPFGGVTTTDSRDLGTEVDLMATYNVNANLQLQSGYFWFFYGDAVTNHPNPGVANRGDADQFYFMVDWKF